MTKKPTADSQVRTVQAGKTRVIGRKHPAHKLLDPYHHVLTLSWPRFFTLLVTLFAGLNLAFGLAYWLVPGSVANARPEAFSDYVFFSIETLATVGYGAMSPANLGGHLIASIEIMLGMASVALTTGLIFARFAKPTARILFGQHAVIRQFDGQRMLMLRIANERYNRIVDASAQLSLARTELTAEGEPFIRIRDLPLVRQQTQVFNLTWTLMHEIDEASPLYQVTAAQLQTTETRIIVSVNGHDEVVAATVYASHNYEAGDVAFDMRFVDVLRYAPDGARMVDLSRFHDIEPTAPFVEPPAASPA